MRRALASGRLERRGSAAFRVLARQGARGSRRVTKNPSLITRAAMPSDARKHPYSAEENSRFVRRSKALFTRRVFCARARARDRRIAAPIFIVGLPRAGSTLIEQILASHSAVEGTMELPDIPQIARELAGRSRRPDRNDRRRGAVFRRGGRLTHEQLRALGERYLADDPRPTQDRGAVLHRQDAQQLAVRGADPSHSAECEDHRCPPPPARLLLVGIQAAFRARPELLLRTRRHRPLLSRLCRADGARRRRAARPACIACSTSP